MGAFFFVGSSACGKIIESQALIEGRRTTKRTRFRFSWKCIDMDVITDQRGWECVERDPFGRVVGLTTRIRRRKTHSVPAYTVLAPVDGSRASLAALRVAADIAGRLAESSLDVLNVQTILGCTGDDDDLLNAGLADTEIARQFLAGADASYHLRLAAGVPVEVILPYIREQNSQRAHLNSFGFKDEP